MDGDDRRWLADEMLGRLARYLRFLGEDVEYARGLDDTAVAAWAAREGRILLTRDHELAKRVPGALLLRSTDVLDQLEGVRQRWPAIPVAPVSRRCTDCNGDLAITEDRVPLDRPGASELEPRTSPVYRCQRCGHRYWEGSHGERLAERLRARFS